MNGLKLRGVNFVAAFHGLATTGKLNASEHASRFGGLPSAYIVAQGLRVARLRLARIGHQFEQAYLFVFAVNFDEHQHRLSPKRVG